MVESFPHPVSLGPYLGPGVGVSKREGKMKAMVYHGNKDLRLEDVEEPEAGPGEMKLRIDYCGICATDIEEYLYGPKFITVEPDQASGGDLHVVTGHELTGTVVDVGGGVNEVRPGDRVVVDGFIPCNACWWCRHGSHSQCPNAAVVGFGRDGGLAEYMTWPAANAVVLPDGVASEAAALNEPASVAYHAVARGRVAPGDRVAVLGAGTVGLLAMQAAKALGAAVYAVDQRQMSLEVAHNLGADGVVNSADDDAGEALRNWTGGSGPDVVIDAAGGRTHPVWPLNGSAGAAGSSWWRSTRLSRSSTSTRSSPQRPSSSAPLATKGKTSKAPSA